MAGRGRSLIFPALIALVLSGCAKPDPHPHGWIAFDVPPPALQPGWHRVQDPVSGVSMDLPGAWLSWDPTDQAQVQAFFDQVRRTVPGAASVHLMLQTQGVTPNLFAMDSSPEGIKPLVFTYAIVMFADVEKRAELDTVERKLRAEGKGTVERLELPIGPCITRYLDSDESAKYGRPTMLRTWTVMFMRDGNLYFFRLTTPRDRFDAVRPVAEQILRSIRVVAPNPSAATARSVPAPLGGMGGPGVMPGTPAYGNQPPVSQQPGTMPGAPSGSNQPPEPPPSAGMPATVPSSPTPQPGYPGGPPQPPANSTGDPNQSGTTGSGQ